LSEYIGSGNNGDYVGGW